MMTAPINANTPRQEFTFIGEDKFEGVVKMKGPVGSIDLKLSGTYKLEEKRRLTIIATDQIATVSGADKQAAAMLSNQLETNKQAALDQINSATRNLEMTWKGEDEFTIGQKGNGLTFKRKK